MEDNRRVLPRWSINRSAKVRLEDAWHFNDCHVDDMNLKGMRISLSDRLPLDRRVRMALSFSDLSFQVEAQIPWMKEENGRFVYGLLFNRIQDEDKNKIEEYIYNNCFDQLKDQWWQ